MKLELYNDDCFNVFKTLLPNSVDYTITSPPYNRKRNDKYEHFDDDIENYFEFLCRCIDNLLYITRYHVFFNIMAQYYNKEDVYRLIGKYANDIQNIIIWEKSNPLPASGFNITNSYEFIIVFGNTSLQSNYTYTKNHITTPVNMITDKSHHAVMNVDVSDWLVSNFTKEGETILDPFMGTGTTGVSCITHKRNFVGIEINKTYFDGARERLEFQNELPKNKNLF